MRTVQAMQFGGPEVLKPTDAPEPVTGDGQLLIDVEVAEVLFLDTQLRAGWGREHFRVDPPFVPGVGVAGTVIGGDEAWRGKRVIAGTSEGGTYAGGGYAERASVPIAQAHEVPARLDSQEALTALHDGLMGVSRIGMAGLTAGDVAMVTAAGGAIGTWLVPLLARDGVRVIAAARGERKLALASERGAAVVLDYAEEGWTDAVTEDVDVVFDGAGGSVGVAAFDRLRDGGRFFSYGAAGGDFPDVSSAAAARDVEVVGLEAERLTPEQGCRAVQTALALLSEGTVDPIIGQVVPLEQAADAHAAIAARAVAGKTLLTL